MGNERIVESGWRYILVAIIVFLLLAADLLSTLVGKMIDGRPLSDPSVWSINWYATVCTFLCSVIIWCVSGTLVVRWLRIRGALDRVLNVRMERRIVPFFLVVIIILAAISWWESSGSGAIFPSVLGEYRAFEHRYPGYGLTVTLFQHLYYILESVMVLLVIALFQRAGEFWTERGNVPWGGIGLTLTWGLAHLSSHPEGLLPVVLIALILGLGFVAVRKSVLPAFAIVYLVFVL